METVRDTPFSSYNDFDTGEYLRRIFAKGSEFNDLPEFLLKHLAKFYSTFDSSSLKILDYGCGPSLGYSISAVSKASEFVLADYSKPNRNYLQKWLDGDASNVFDWTPLFQYVVQTLEGGSEGEAKQREHDLRSKVKAVVHCDIMQDEFIDTHYRDTYDIVMCFLCLDSVVDNASYISGIAKLSSLIKEGGHLLLYSTRRENSDEGFYFIGGVKYHNVALKRDFLVETLRKNGLTIEIEDYLASSPGPVSNHEGVIFFSARKN